MKHFLELDDIQYYFFRYSQCYLSSYGPYNSRRLCKQTKNGNILFHIVYRYILYIDENVSIANKQNFK